MADVVDSSSGVSFKNLFSEMFYSPLNLILASVCAFLIYKIFSSSRKSQDKSPPRPAELPPLKKQDMTLQELRKYDGSGPDGRVLVAVNNKTFDVTKGKHFYGPGGPYHAFAGRDASRGLATFSIDAAKEEYDDLSDLNSMEMESVREWEMQFTEKYHYVGRLLKPGEEPTDYSDEEDTSQEQQQQHNKKEEPDKARSSSSDGDKPHTE